jgi:hypothetical protein
MDATAMKEAKEELAKLVAAQAAEDVWTTPAMNEKIRIEKLARQLAKTGDPEAQRFVAEQVTLCKHVNTAGDMARALTVEQDLPGPADPQALAKIVALRHREPHDLGVRGLGPGNARRGPGEGVRQARAPL